MALTAFLAWPCGASGFEGGLPGAFLEAGSNARPLGMGGAFSAVAEGPSAVVWNPAGLGMPERTQASFSYVTLFEGASLQELSARHSFRAPFGIGLGIVRYSMGEIPERDSSNQELGEFQDNKTAVLAGAGCQPFEGLSIGMTGKVMHEELATSGGTGTDLDLGALAKIKMVNLGLEVQNLAGTPYRRVGGTNELPRVIRFGAAAKVLKPLLLSADVVVKTPGDTQVRAGAEFAPWDWAAVRAGWEGGSPAFGMGFAYAGAGIDYAALYDATLGMSHRVSIGYAFGPSAQDKVDARAAWRRARFEALLAILETGRQARAVVLLDSCFSGRTPEGKPLVEGLQPLVLGLAAPAGVGRAVLMTAARSDQFAGPLPGNRRPAFSYLALGGLRGWADSDKDGKITARELVEYARKSLAAVVRDRTQEPELVGGTGSEVLGIGREKGPDLSERALDDKAASVDFKVSPLSEMPKVQAPSSLGDVPRAMMPETLAKQEGMDFGSLDVDELEKYDKVVQFEKSDAAPEKKAAKWRSLGKDVKAYAEPASRRAQEWDGFAAESAFNAVVEFEQTGAEPGEKAGRWRSLGKAYSQYKQKSFGRAEEWERYARELKAAEDAKARRAEVREKDWLKLKRLMALSVVSEGDKQRFARVFVEAYGIDPEENQHAWELRTWLPASGSAKTNRTGAPAADMALVPAGDFIMGSQDGEPNERPAHKVYLDAFYVDKTEVTVAQFRAFAKAAGRAMPGQPDWSTDAHPVVNVDWNDANAYCEWKGRRLPTEAEWEKAARGGTGTRYHFGDDPGALSLYAWHYDNSGGHAHPVGQRNPNQYGLFDMHGNAWEWVADWYDEAYYRKSPERAPQGAAYGRLRALRGGGWSVPASSNRAAARTGNLPDAKIDVFGFRCAKPAP